MISIFVAKQLQREHITNLFEFPIHVFKMHSKHMGKEAALREENIGGDKRASRDSLVAEDNLNSYQRVAGYK